MFRFATSLAALTGAVLLGSCAKTDPSGPSAGGPPPPPPNTVDVLNNYFNPVSLTVPVGTTVTWNWPVVSRRHNLLPEGGGTVPYSPDIVDGPYSYSYRFDQTGRYDYYCLEHGGMRGTIIVQ